MYLSLDLSPHNTGWVYFNSGREVINHGILSSKGGDMIQQIHELLLTFCPRITIIEDVHGGVNMSTTLILCRFQGIILNLCSMIGIYTVLFSCSTARRILFGYNMNKKDTFRLVNLIFIECSNEHVIDAYVIGMGYLFRHIK